MVNIEVNNSCLHLSRLNLMLLLIILCYLVNHKNIIKTIFLAQ